MEPKIVYGRREKDKGFAMHTRSVQSHSVYLYVCVHEQQACKSVKGKVQFKALLLNAFASFVFILIGSVCLCPTKLESA